MIMMKVVGNKRLVRERGGSLVVTIPSALAADKRIKDGTICEWRTTTDGLLLVPVGQKNPEEENDVSR